MTPEQFLTDHEHSGKEQFADWCVDMFYSAGICLTILCGICKAHADGPPGFDYTNNIPWTNAPSIVTNIYWFSFNTTTNSFYQFDYYVESTTNLLYWQANMPVWNTNWSLWNTNEFHVIGDGKIYFFTNISTLPCKMFRLRVDLTPK